MNLLWQIHYKDQYGIKVKPVDKRAGFHNIIENNISFDNDNLVVEIQDDVELPWDYTDGNGIIVDWCRDADTSTLVQNNICFNNGGRGIQITVSSNVTVINNIASDRWLNNPKGEITGTLGANNIQNQDPFFTRAVPVVGFTKDSREDFLLSNPDNYNFGLKAGSPAINAGTASLPAGTDFYGNTRSTVDLGAIAFNEAVFSKFP